MGISQSVKSAGHRKIPKLTEDEICYYESKTRFSAHEVLQLHKAFRHRGASDGGIDKEDFIDMFSNYMKSAKALLFLDHVFRTWDFDANGNLRRPLSGMQIYAPMQHVRSGCHVHVTRDNFQMIGHEKNRYLFELKDSIIISTTPPQLNEFEDFILALSVTGRGTKQERYEYLFRLYDADGSGEITIDEFSSSLKFRLKKMELAEMEEIFTLIDVDGSGAIDLKEFVTACMTNTLLMEYLDLY